MKLALTALKAITNETASKKMLAIQAIEKKLRLEDIVRVFPEMANHKQLEQECFVESLVFCKESDLNPHKECSWNAYINQDNARAD